MRAREALARMGVAEAKPGQLSRLTGKVELLLWKLLKLRWYEVHRFFSSVEPDEAKALIEQSFAPGKVFHFFSERQTPDEWEDMLTVGICLVFAATRRAFAQGINPRAGGPFALQHMAEQVIESVGGLEDLIRIGHPSRG